MDPDKNTSIKRHTMKKLWVIVVAIVAIAIVGIAALSLFKPSFTEQPVSQQKDSSTSDNIQTDEEVAKTLKPCEFLADTERAMLQFGKGKVDNRNIRMCEWRTPEKLTVIAAVYTVYGLGQMGQSQAGSAPKPLKIGSHNAQRSTIEGDTLSAGTCIIDIAIGTNESATIRILANLIRVDTTTKSCAAAMETARLIEPKLP